MSENQLTESAAWLRVWKLYIICFHLTLNVLNKEVYPINASLFIITNLVSWSDNKWLLSV